MASGSTPMLRRNLIAFDDSYEEDGEGGVLEILPIDEAHGRDGL
jgi:hypothetical protein